MATIIIPATVRQYFPRQIDPAQLLVHYSAETDSLTIYFTGEPVPSVWEDIDRFAYLGYAPDDAIAATGFMIEHFSQWLLVPGQAVQALQPA